MDAEWRRLAQRDDGDDDDDDDEDAPQKAGTERMLLQLTESVDGSCFGECISSF
jgi:hypothetical protein